MRDLTITITNFLAFKKAMDGIDERLAQLEKDGSIARLKEHSDYQDFQKTLEIIAQMGVSAEEFTKKGW